MNTPVLEHKIFVDESGEYNYLYSSDESVSLYDCSDFLEYVNFVCEQEIEEKRVTKWDTTLRKIFYRLISVFGCFHYEKL